jgi:hypothetical protein
MAFSRDVLRKVPAFDEELGPGALGFGDEELFALQLQKAGYKIFGCLNVEVEHHFQPSRLLRRAWLDGAARRGRVNAYLTYHWQHRGYKLAGCRLLYAQAQLLAWRAFHPGPRSESEEGCSEREMNLIFRCAELEFYIQERRKPRKYEHCGLVKHAQSFSAIQHGGLNGCCQQA